MSGISNESFQKHIFENPQTYDVFLGISLGWFLVGFQDKISKAIEIIPHVTDTILSHLNKSKLL